MTLVAAVARTPVPRARGPRGRARGRTLAPAPGPAPAPGTGARDVETRGRSMVTSEVGRQRSKAAGGPTAGAARNPPGLPVAAARAGKAVRSTEVEAAAIPASKATAVRAVEVEVGAVEVAAGAGASG